MPEPSNDPATTGTHRSVRLTAAAGVGLRRASSAVVLILAVGVVLWLGRAFLVPFAAAGLLAVAVTPPARWLESRTGVPPFVTTALALVVTGAVTAVILALGYVGVANIVSRAPEYHDDVVERYDALRTIAADRLGERAAKEIPDIETLVGTGEFEDEAIGLAKDRSTGALARRGVAVITTTANTGMNLVSGFFLTLVFFAFFLTQREPLRAKVLDYLIERGTSEAESSEVLEHMGRRVTQYLWLKAAISIVTGVVFGLVAWIGGLPFALFWGFLGFVLNFVPTIGPVVASVPPVLLSFVEFELGYAALLSSGLIGVQTLSGAVVEPKLLGDRLNLNVMAVLLCLFFWAIVWGPMGMLLAVPLTAMLQIAFEHAPTTRPMANLLAATRG